jgi:hypothetical protein
MDEEGNENTTGWGGSVASVPEGPLKVTLISDNFPPLVAAI